MTRKQNILISYFFLISHLFISIIDNELGHYSAYVFANILVLTHIKSNFNNNGPLIKLWLLISLFALLVLSFTVDGSILSKILFYNYFFLTFMLLSLILQYSQSFNNHIGLGKDIALYIFLVLMASFLVNNNSVGRFSGFYENVLNFTGLIAVIASLIFLRLKAIYFLLYLIGLSILTFMSQSKALALVLLSSAFIYVFRISKSLALTSVVLSLGMIFAFLAYIDFELIADVFSLSQGATLDRLDRYFRLSEITLNINTLANPTLCSRFYIETCLTSESFVVGSLLSYGLLTGTILFVLFAKLALRLEVLPLLFFMIFSAGLFTPSILFVTYCLILIYISKEALERDKDFISTKS